MENDNNAVDNDAEPQEVSVEKVPEEGNQENPVTDGAEPITEDNTGEPSTGDNTGQPSTEDNTGEPSNGDNTGEPSTEDNTGEPSNGDNTGEPGTSDETKDSNSTEKTVEPSTGGIDAPNNEDHIGETIDDEKKGEANDDENKEEPSDSGGKAEPVITEENTVDDNTKESEEGQQNMVEGSGDSVEEVTEESAEVKGNDEEEANENSSQVEEGNLNNNAGGEGGEGEGSNQTEEGHDKTTTESAENGEDSKPHTEGDVQGETATVGDADSEEKVAESKDDEGQEKEDTVTAEDQAKQEKGETTEVEAPKDADEGGKDTEGEQTSEDKTKSEEKEGSEEEEKKIPSDFFYDYEEHASRARVTEESGLPENIMNLEHSFGYDCHKMSNLHMVDPDTVLFAAGNVLQILNLQTSEQKYIRSMSGGGIGAVTVHPSGKYFVVAEKGEMPNIAIYQFPSLRLYRILRGGTEKAYSFVDFNPSGTLLASVGSYPDFMLTVWDWEQEKTMLRTKAFSQDVFRVTFSPENEGQLTSSGTGHIRFWKMARTFTGLKLQGQLGKFGRTEITDIRGYVELPDGKVLSGTEWGNMLLWEGGLIKVQISRKNKKPCHAGTIEQFVMDEGELISIGADGFVRVWDFESIDTADSMDDSGIFEMEPMNELKVGNSVHLMSMVKTLDPEATSIWYAQDANGGIWRLDLSFSHTMETPEKLFSFHSGVISQVASSPVSQLVASAGLDNAVNVYDYISKSMLCNNKFNSGATSLLWLPDIVDPKGSTVLAGFKDGVVRALMIARNDDADSKRGSHVREAELLLKQAFKPHTKTVSTMKIDTRGELLATGGEDGTVFFLSIGDGFSPIGFIETPGPVSNLTWAPGYHEKNTLLIFCSNGEIMEVEAPEPGKYDTSKTFKIEGLASRRMTFRSIKSRLRREEEEARKREEEEKRRQEDERKRQLRRQRGLDSDDEEEKKDEEKEEEDEEPEPLYIPDVPSPILFGVYSPHDPNTFWVSMGDFDAGYLYECKFFDDQEKAMMIKASQEEAINEPIRSVAVVDSDDVPIRTISFTHDGKYAILGMENGVIRVQTVEAKEDKDENYRQPNLNQADLSSLTNYWMLNVHDNNYGSITTLVPSFDDRHIFSSAADGNFFVFTMMTTEQIEEAQAVAKAKIPSARKDDELLRTVDIESKDHYSIELEKQQAEYDKMMRLAEEKKTDVRRTIAKLRRQFKKLLEKNQELPEKLQLERKEFEMDPGIRRELERQTKDRIELVHKELAWEAEKHRIALEKLQQRFKAELEFERVVVVSIKSSHQVATYRTTELSKEFHVLREEMNRKPTMVSEKALSREATQDSFGGDPKLSQSNSDTALATEMQGAKKPTLLTGRLGEKVNQALQKAEKAKQKRLNRQKQWEELRSSKPPEDHEDPADVQAIKEAQENMGDFKLKTAKDYVVPEHLRMNALKKRNQLLVLEELMHEYKMEFNHKVLALRDKKINIIEKIKKYLDDISELQENIAQDQRKELPECPTLQPMEVPERKFQYTRETLLKFKEEMAQKKLEAITGQGGGGFGGGFGGFGGGGGGTADKKEQANAATPASGRVRSRLSLRSAQATMSPSVSRTSGNLSTLEQQLAAAEDIRLIYRQDKMLQQINDLIANFDAELRMLRHSKFNLDIDLKNSDLRKVTLFEELQLLKEFEKRENVLAEKVEAKIKEKTDMYLKVVEIQQKHDGKRKDIDRLSEKEKALYATFQASLGENNKFAEFLNKVFKKKIKRAKKKAQNEEGSNDDESEESSEEESDWSSEDEESDDDALDDSVCPPGCEQELFDNTCALREKRLDIEELMAEEKKTADGLKKEVDALVKKQKVIETNLKTAEADLEAFQLEKQQKLNELDVVVTLRFHQIEYMVNGTLPQDLSPCLVFTTQSIRNLKKRILELEEEKTAQKQHYKEHRQQHIQLIKDRRLMEQRIQDLEEQCNQAMRLKFGQIIDLDKLDTVGVNRNIEELKEKIRIGEIDNAKDLQKMDDKIDGKKGRITELIEENTHRLQLMTMKLGEKKELEKALDARQTSLMYLSEVGGEYQGSRKADTVERKRLIQLVQLQAQEIDALKDEIGLLSRKGGHILPPSQPPLPHSSSGNTRSNLPTGQK
ncbi:cilia- and flagella-associated protein 44-like isoform X2 [Apostichopus japonicus]|uniref:cilia- and flagella-associated protein 44-like isoform X2 n=1 Tax=Stichopus japonicus TaxID=307972 RepID=UPI003AB80473